MNQDHAGSLTAMVKHFTGLTVDSTFLVALDRLGMDCICMKGKDRLKCRLPYTRYGTLCCRLFHVCRLIGITAVLGFVMLQALLGDCLILS